MLPYAGLYAGGSVLLLLTNWIAVTIPLYLAEAIDALWKGSGALAVVQRNALIIAVLGVAVIGIRTASRVAFFTPGRLVEAQLKEEMFGRLLRQQPPFLRQWPTGDLVSRASSDVNFLRLLAGFGVLGLVNTSAAAVLTTVQMLRISPALALWILGPVSVGLLFTQLFIRRMFRLVHQMQDELAQLSDHVLSSYQGVATVHGFVAESRFLDRFDVLNDRYTLTSMQRAEMRAAITPTLGLAASLNVFLLLFVGGPMAIRGDISVGDLVAFTTLVAYLSGPLRSVSFLISIVKQAQAALERIDAVMAPAPDRPDLPDPEPAPHRPPEIELVDLSFTYPHASGHKALDGVSVRIPAGSTLGILGPTGAGKTTLLRCLARLENPPPGTIRVDGTDLLQLDLDAWRQCMVFVPQRAFLFSESLRDNVLLGAPDDGRLERALGLSAMDADVVTLPSGTDTLVGESGVMLSGGQRQRTALARGLVRDHVVLVLDDVLSAVDHGTEHELITALRSAEQTPTTIIVSHRVSALQHASQIAVLRDGRLEDLGTHEELLSRPGFYRETWERQAEGDES